MIVFYSSYSRTHKFSFSIGGTVMSVTRRLFCLTFGVFAIYVGYKSAEVGGAYLVGGLLNVDPTETTK